MSLSPQCIAEWTSRGRRHGLESKAGFPCLPPASSPNLPGGGGLRVPEEVGASPHANRWSRLMCQGPAARNLASTRGSSAHGKRSGEGEMPELRRAQQRVTAVLPVKLDGRPAGTTRDISPSGIFFETD